jgi:exonuclease VII small subunit
MAKEKQSHRYAVDSLGLTINHIQDHLEQIDMCLETLKRNFEKGEITQEEYEESQEQNKKHFSTRESQLDAILDEVERGGFNLEIPYIDFLNTINSPDYMGKKDDAK